MSEKIESSSKLNTPPLEYLRQCFRYEPDTGKVFWLERPRSHFAWDGGKKCADRRAGKEAGNVFCHSHHNSPVGMKTTILYLGQRINIYMHHVAWRLTHGDIPDGHEVDHRNNDPCQNWIKNLRLATRSQNLANQRDQRSTRRGLPRGVRKGKNMKSFTAVVGFRGKIIRVGSYPTPELAHQAYLEKAKELHGRFFKHFIGQGETGD